MSDNSSTSSSKPQHPFEVSLEEFKTLQNTDTTLEAIQKAVKGPYTSAGVGFFQKKGLIYTGKLIPGSRPI